MTTTTSVDSRPDYQPLIHDLPVNERPRERLEHYGARALSNAELLAIMLRVGSHGQSAVSLGQQLLLRYGGSRGLAKAAIAELCQQGQLRRRHRRRAKLRFAYDASGDPTSSPEDVRVTHQIVDAGKAQGFPRENRSSFIRALGF